MTEKDETRLQAALAKALPSESKFHYHHISTPPRRCEPLFAAPPGRKEERTYCESHFLNVSITIPETRRQSLTNRNNTSVAVFAIELLVYTTKRLTTVFVSKADSTGYLHLLGLPKGNFSPLRDIASTFISQVVAHRRRKNVDLVLTLFARSADQYLFPGSVENAGKHVADDRQLVKWWCRTLGPLVHGQSASSKDSDEHSISTLESAQAYIIVPGEESITSFLPDNVKYDTTLRTRWTHGHPLRSIASYPVAPPRCLVPRFPDDPKSRFIDQLDEELRDGVSASQGVEASPSKKGSGQWRSVKSLEQFWEMMAYRQECSSGRLVGFVWVVFPKSEEHDDIVKGDSQDSQATSASLTTSTETGASFTSVQSDAADMSGNKLDKASDSKRRRPLAGLIIPRQPRIKSMMKVSATSVNSMPINTPYYYWPEELRGDLVLDDRSYEKATDMQSGILSRLDFANLVVAAKGTTTWIDEVGVLSGLVKGSAWGRTAVGTKQLSLTTNGAWVKAGTAAAPNVMMVTKKKRKAEDSAESPAGGVVGQTAVNTLNGDLSRQKSTGKTTAAAITPAGSANGINTLGAGLVRKKPKA